MIQHGDFFTVYQNLSSVFVNKGDKVSIKQSLGKIRTNGETEKRYLNLPFPKIQPTTILQVGCLICNVLNFLRWTIYFINAYLKKNIIITDIVYKWVLV